MRLFLPILTFCSIVKAILQPTFRDTGYKNIAFSVSPGGSSHHNWVLSIMDLLGQRGHNTTYLTTTEETRFSKSYHHVKTVDIGPSVVFDQMALLKELSSGKSMLHVMPKVMKAWSGNHERDYFTLLNYFKNHQVDLVLCDYFMNACVDAATSFGIPYIMTCALDPSKESDVSYTNSEWYNMHDFTTEHQSFATRFYYKFIFSWINLYKNYSYYVDMTARRKAIGITTKLEPPNKKWRHSLRLVNNLFGYIPARPIGSLAEYVGPIIPQTHSPLSEELEYFLNSHQRVVYIAFGQLAIPKQETIKLILIGLLENLESGSIDGFVWATVHAAGNFPASITTSSGINYNIETMLKNEHSYAYMVTWAPQTAILLHPSTCVFVSHGGLGSWHESMYAGVPMILFPFFADQPGNALLIERSGLGGILKTDATQTESVELFRNIIEDVNGEIKANVKRMQALTQIHSKHGTMRGADLVEEVAYTHKNGVLPHRQSPADRMSVINGYCYYD
ncbi:uncharacterized protein EV154DRAFT_589009 [Mucor mucedo]|uniref:uncharacterized protein n=1 Tax=Mucor mucedo TaxID=29922 RepID=UPI00221F5F9A|nr:uncharacterized protein EV154DRAFT_589009 [Mucor mucedo]KAI7891094.1 hypothetical protein EV154DRAFT_589009 [Mucor mucedo]